MLYAGLPHADMPNWTIGETERASMLELFGPFVTVRHELGRPVKVFWCADGEVSRYFTKALAVEGGIW